MFGLVLALSLSVQVYNHNLEKFVDLHNKDFIRSTKKFDQAIEEFWMAQVVVDIRDRNRAQEEKKRVLERAGEVERELEKLLEQWRRVKASLEKIDAVQQERVD